MTSWIDLSLAHRVQPAWRRSSLALAASLACWAWPAQVGAQQAAAPAAAASAPAAAAPAARPADPTAPKPFAEVIKDAKQQDGLLPIWRKDDKTWLEISPELLGKPLLLTANISQSVGERGLYGSQMARDWLVAFRRVGNTMQLVALNMAYRGGTDLASQQTLKQAFSDSLLAATPVASAAHAERKSVLVDASFLLGDLVGYSTYLETAYRLPYNLDRANSSLERTAAEAGQSSLSARLHFATARLPAPPLVPSPVPTPALPQTLPDARSLFVGVVYSFVPLPEQPMATRLADPRLGHFTEAFTDFATDLQPKQRVHYVQRWRLEKKNPDASLSEPVQPITFWLDRNIPARYRPAVEAGVLEWNKAFEKIGYRNALVVKQQPDDAEFDTLDARHASIRWFVGSDVGFARGPSVTDPRTGEILDADIAMSDVFARGARRVLVEDSGTSSASVTARLAALGEQLGRHVHDAYCAYGLGAAEEMHFALDLLEARGELAPDSPEAEAFVNAVIKDTITHEVGHTLGLKHNFKASTTVSQAQLRDATYTRLNGISGSVMDYLAYNLPLQGEPAASANQTTLGAYDYWAIEYAYTPLAPDQEATGLAKIAARSTEPALAFADDADADGPNAVDPRVNRFDLGDDPLAWAQRRMALSRELWARVQARTPQAGEDPGRARRSLLSGFRQLRGLPELMAKYVGGLYSQRSLPAVAGTQAYRPVEAERQREALRQLTTGLFALDSFRFKPEFLANLGPDYDEWERAAPVSIPTLVLQLQTQALDRLLAAGTAQRLLDTPLYLPEAERKRALALDEVYAQLHSAIWGELKTGKDVEPLRRSLQREHLKRLVQLLTRPPANLPADALSLLRWQAVQLQTELKTAAAKPGLPLVSRAHYADSLATLTEALRATMSRG